MRENPRALLVVMSHPVEGARELARRLVEERLVACAQVLPPMTSFYPWKGELVEDSECLVLLKTLAPLQERLFSRIKELHPYTVPEIMSFPAEGVWPDYHRWMVQELAPEA